MTVTGRCRANRVPDFVVHIDGSSLHNPGPAGIGVRLIRANGEVTEISHPLGIKTNNQAEYEALLCALRKLAEFGSPSADIFTDSQLLYCQIVGQYRVRNRNLQELHQQARDLLVTLPGVAVRYFSRDENARTDRLARRAARAAAAALNDARA